MMLLRLSAAALFAGAAWFVLSAAGTAHAQGKDEKAVTLTIKDNEGKTRLAAGTTLVVKLDMQAGTGYGWVVARSDAKVLKSLGKPTIERPDKDKKVVGGKATQVFRFEAVAKGTGELELHYKRVFEKDKPPAKTFKVQVVVE
ncbi:MAG: protease inhibitor I42 family protein [Gemmataceae bacterium]|nr:protease inhibitor I42 family protein [Gemmataceae bacterium]